MDSSGNITDEDFINDITEDENENHNDQVLLDRTPKKDTHNNLSFQVEHTTEFKTETKENFTSFNDIHDADLLITSLRKEKKMLQDNLSRYQQMQCNVTFMVSRVKH